MEIDPYFCANVPVTLNDLYEQHMKVTQHPVAAAVLVLAEILVDIRCAMEKAQQNEPIKV